MIINVIVNNSKDYSLTIVIIYLFGGYTFSPVLERLFAQGEL